MSVAAAPSSEAAVEDSRGACPECARAWKECTCAESPSCWICLESSGELLRGCACRGTAGYLHIACLVDWNRHRNNAHAECWQCQKRFVGVLSMAAAEARVRDARASSSNFDCVASNELAQACAEQGRHPEALQHYHKILRQQLKRFGPDHPDVANAKTNIGSVLCLQGKLSEAYAVCEEAVTIHQKVLGEHPDTAQSIMGVAIVLKEMDKPNEAVKKFNEVLQIQEKALGRSHLEVAKTQDNMAIVYRRMGKLNKALELSQSALAVMEKVLGREHPDVAQTYGNTGLVDYSMGDFPKALEYHNCDLEIKRQVFGHDHPHVAATYGNISLVLESQGKHPEALEMLQKCLKIHGLE